MSDSCPSDNIDRPSDSVIPTVMLSPRKSQRDIVYAFPR